MGNVDGVLARLGVPEKLRILLPLSMRRIFILVERAGTMVRAVQLQGPGLKGIPMCRIFACVLGTTLVHGSERMMLAIRRCGGMAGFC